ncbi:MAG: signal peptidase I [Clostridiales bacterium]|nr:signal peptidase I [Clostridiales bacterium]
MASDKEKEPRSWQQNVLLYVHDLMCMLLVVMLLFLVVFRVILVTGDSMFTTLWDGDYLLLISNLFCGDPEPGDIVVISKQSFDHGSPIVKRVIAIQGQTVDIDFESGTVYVDGQALREPYIHNETTNEEGTQFPLTVAENCVFVLGDNRAVSLDSRSPQIGQIDRREVLGKALFLMIPGTHHGQLLPDYSRIGAVH